MRYNRRKWKPLIGWNGLAWEWVPSFFKEPYPLFIYMYSGRVLSSKHCDLILNNKFTWAKRFTSSMVIWHWFAPKVQWTTVHMYIHIITPLWRVRIFSKECTDLNFVKSFWKFPHKLPCTQGRSCRYAKTQLRTILFAYRPYFLRTAYFYLHLFQLLNYLYV